MINSQFSFVKTRFPSLAKDTAHLATRFAMSNLWMAFRHLASDTGEVCL